MREELMLPNRQKDIERGMELIPKLPEIMPDKADERISLVYQDIQQTLRVPFVNFIFRTLANYPDYFEPTWQRFAQIFKTKAFERVADELRTQALLENIPDARLSGGKSWVT
jgi:hypothetical protein